ncbi:MAG: ribonuclease HII [Bdellovibrionales bacterium]
MPDLAHEIHHGRAAGKVVCGVDEVGRGPLAGPVMAAAVILPTDIPKALTEGIRDSKKMSEIQRETLFDPIRESCRFCVAEASVEEIGDLNILQASLLAMRRAVAGLNLAPDTALIDGNRRPGLACQEVTIVKGDDKSLSIAAASILAKVQRDRFMSKLAQDFPGYGWEHNAGYPTPEHLEALSRLGVTPWHRATFAPVSKYLELRKHEGFGHSRSSQGP